MFNKLRKVDKDLWIAAIFLTGISVFGIVSVILGQPMFALVERNSRVLTNLQANVDTMNERTAQLINYADILKTQQESLEITFEDFLEAHPETAFRHKILERIDKLEKK